MAVGLLKNECDHEINNKILLEKCYLKLHFMTIPCLWELYIYAHFSHKILMDVSLYVFCIHAGTHEI